jgi:hypothetical protein
MCDHLFDTTTRYDSEQHKLLTFLLLCRACGTSRIVERLSYEPRFQPGLTAMGVARGE